MAEYRPCPWCRVDVTTTAPLKVVPRTGSVPQVSQPGVFWDRSGGKQTEKGCPSIARSKT
jgi:hypothetical protein